MAIGADGTVQVVSVSGSSYYQAGNPTLNSVISGVGRTLFVHSASAGTPLTSFGSGGTNYDVFGIGYTASTSTPPSSVPALGPLGLGITGCLLLFGGLLGLRLPSA